MNKQSYLAWRILVFLWHLEAIGGWFWGANNALAIELIPPGVLGKLSAGAGDITVHGGMAVFYNPANLGVSTGYQAEGDLSLAAYRYSYTHTDKESYSPVTIAQTAPPISLAFSARLSESWSLGLGFFPTGIGEKQIIIDIPLYLGDGFYQIADVELIQSGSKLALGTAYKVNKSLLLGMSVLRISEKADTSIFKAGDRYAFLRTISEGDFYQPALGSRFFLGSPNLTVGLSLRPSIVKKYKGKFLFDLVGEDQSRGILNFLPTKQVDILPASLGLGGSYKGQKWRAHINFFYEMWKSGQSKVTRGLPIASPKQDLKDTLNYMIGGSFLITQNDEIHLTVGVQPSNLNDGSKFVKPSSVDAPALGLLQESSTTPKEGMTFGNTSGLNRRVFSLGYERAAAFLASSKIKSKGYFALGLYRLDGSRTVPSGYSQEGQYNLEITMATLGLAYRF